MKAITLYFTPLQLAKVRGVSIKEIFKEIHKGTIEVLITEEGVKIPITYKFEE